MLYIMVTQGMVETVNEYKISALSCQEIKL